MERKLFVLAAILFLAVLAFVGCKESGGPAPSTGTPTPVPGTPTALPGFAPPVQGLAASVSVDKATFGPGEPVRMTLVIENVSAETKRLSFRNGQRYDFAIEDSGGRQVWRWSADKFFIQVLGEEVIAPGQRLVYGEEWDQRDQAGSQVPEGSYTVRGFTVGCLEGSDICEIGSTASFSIGGPH